MKQFVCFIGRLVCLTAVVVFFVQCSVTSSVIGDVTWMNASGQVVSEWDSATIQETTYSVYGSVLSESAPLKEGGFLYFKTRDGKERLINGGMIMVDNIRYGNTDGGVSASEPVPLSTASSVQTEVNIDKEKLMDLYLEESRLEKEASQYRKNKDTDRLRQTRRKMRETRKKMREVEHKINVLTGNWYY